MAKKKTVKLDEPLRDPAPFTEGIQVMYKHNVIIQEDDDCEYALLTANSIVEQNIGVAYRKPEAVPVGTLINLTDTAETEHAFSHNANPVIADSGDGYQVGSFENGNSIIPFYSNHAFHVEIGVNCATDALNVTANNIALEYDSREHQYIYDDISETYPDSLTLIISDKTGGK